jgi:hypothetical protein
MDQRRNKRDKHDMLLATGEMKKKTTSVQVEKFTSTAYYHLAK